jgi:hypothetical protein
MTFYRYICCRLSRLGQLLLESSFRLREMLRQAAQSCNSAVCSATTRRSCAE